MNLALIYAGYGIVKAAFAQFDSGAINIAKLAARVSEYNTLLANQTVIIFNDNTYSRTNSL